MLFVLVMVAGGVGYCEYPSVSIAEIIVPSDATDADRVASVDRWMEKQFEKSKFNGGLLVTKGGKVLLAKTHGFTDHNATQRLNERSAFQLASISKQFTAAAVLRLVEQGLLNLDDPLTKHLDGFSMENVSIRHLLNQTSGIPDEYLDLAERHRQTLGGELTISKVAKLVSQHSKAVRAPGVGMEYSNTNYVLLAAIVESVSGMSYEKFMMDELFKPLGMNDTRVWTVHSGDRSPNQIGEFARINDKRTPINPTWLDGAAGDGGVYSSLHDFAIWDQFWDGNSLVSDNLLQQAFIRPTLNDGEKSGYGFGWFIERNCHWHDGEWLGARTYIVRYPQSRCCIVILDNSTNLKLPKIADKIEESLRPMLLGD
jgi:CubicO group peptidase (beta-lactamase class C family)